MRPVIGGELVFGRKEPPPTQSQLVMNELAETYGHLRQAAGHVAGGAAEKLTPPYDRAKKMANRSWTSTRDAFAPMYEQLREGAATARRQALEREIEAIKESQRRRRWPALLGLLATGAAVGAAGAIVAKRRRAAAEWDEYEPMTSIEELPYGADKPGAGQKVTAGAASVADSVSAQAGKVADSLHDKSGTPRSGTASDVPGRAEPMAEKTADKTKSSAEKAADKTASKAGDVVDRP